jgi:hypothetical protein
MLPTFVSPERQQHYVIVDCAHLDSLFYHESIQAPDIYCKSLFTGTQYASGAVAGPLLCKVEPERNSLPEKLLAIEKECPQAVLWLWSPREFPELYVSLQSLLFAQDMDGNMNLLRYYDPRCLENLLELYQQDPDAREALQDITAWASMQDDGQYRYL